MLAWRLCRERYAKLDGIGAAKVGGRWNPARLAMVYMSATDALAVLEVRVHLRRYIPDTYVFVTAEIPVELIDRVEHHSAFPPDWRNNLDWTQSVGRNFIHESWSVALSVPSRMVPAGRNILVNPYHADFSEIAVQPPERFDRDERLWERTMAAFGVW